jgi:hypothetical protein
VTSSVFFPKLSPTAESTTFQSGDTLRLSIFGRTHLDRSSRYRRSFDWRIGYGDRSSQIASTAFARLSTSEYPELLEDMLELTRKRRKNRTVIAKLQMWLLEELLVQEGAVRHYRLKGQELKGVLEEEGTSEPDKNRLTKDLEFIEEQIFFHRAYSNCIRIIGDGIAWRSLGYDRIVMRSLGEAPTKQHVLAEGTMTELREWALNFDTGKGLAILNSLTNCLAIGDVTVIRDDGSAEIVEVKEGKTKSSRIVRQKQKMRETVNLLATGAGVSDDKFVEVEHLDITPENGLNELAELLEASEKTGWAAKRISNCCYVECVDFARVDSPEALGKSLDAARKKQTEEWSQRSDKVLHSSSLNILSYSPNCAPFSVFPLRSKLCVDLMVGAKSYAVYLNLNAVQREWEYRGWRVKRSFEEQIAAKDEDAMLIVQKDGYEVQIPPAEIMRVWMELIRPTVMIKQCEIDHRRGPRRERFSYVVYDGEPSIWD